MLLTSVWFGMSVLSSVYFFLAYFYQYLMALKESSGILVISETSRTYLLFCVTFASSAVSYI